MIVNLSDVFTMGGKTEEQDILPELEKFESVMGSFPVTKKEPVPFRISNVESEKAKIEGNLRISLGASCDRCLKDVTVDLNLQIERYVASPKIATEEDIEDNPFINGYQLDMETLIQNEILENWPVKILCKEDCKGVCPVCGQNLNERECGCDTFVPDPRMAAIKDIFKLNKEV